MSWCMKKKRIITEEQGSLKHDTYKFYPNHELLHLTIIDPYYRVVGMHVYSGIMAVIHLDLGIVTSKTGKIEGYINANSNSLASVSSNNVMTTSAKKKKRSSPSGFDTAPIHIKFV